jgi:DNA-binding winged helix-turn-helix (wHTH) protein
MFGKRFVFLFLFFSFSCAQPQDDEKHRIVLFRTIGHRLLLASADSTSRILPIQKTNPVTYQIRFQNSFEIMPDSLANITIDNLKSTNPQNQYRVSVFTCQKSEMVYGFEWSPKSTEDLTCLGRRLPENCYVVEIEVLTSGINPNILWGALVALMFLLLFFVVFFIKNEKNVAVSTENISEFQKVGAFKYFQQSGVLILELQKIQLSEKENKLLHLLLKKPNETTAREHLLKEIWENEGVFVISRNLDVLISKLRKKLATDPSVRITNSHGKGYKLEMNS